MNNEERAKLVESIEEVCIKREGMLRFKERVEKLGESVLDDEEAYGLDRTLEGMEAELSHLALELARLCDEWGNAWHDILFHEIRKPKYNLEDEVPFP